MQTYTTGSTIFNKLLNGGYKNECTCYFGAAATGKTTLAILAAIQIAKQKKKVLYIDSENSFSGERAEQLGATHQDLQYIFIIKCSTLAEQERHVLSANKKLFSMLIIDTIGIHYRKCLQENYSNANTSMALQLKALLSISGEIPVIVTNQVYTNMYSNQQVGGKFITDAMHTIIELKNSEVRSAILHKPSKNKIIFTITENEIKN